MKTKLISVLLICAFIACIPLSSCDQKSSTDIGSEKTTDDSNADIPTQTQFIDTPQWAAETLTFVSEKGLMVGVDNNRFDSQSIITKKEVAATLYRLAGSPEEIPKNTFCGDLDDTSKWYYNAAIWCAYHQAMSLYQPWGYGGGYFEPDKIMTRSDIVESVYRFAYHYMKQVDRVGEYVNGAYTRGDVGTCEELFAHGFIDSSKVGEAWRWAVKQGIIFGYDDNSLRPNNCVTRAEFAAIITRFVKHYDLQFE